MCTFVMSKLSCNCRREIIVLEVDQDHHKANQLGVCKNSNEVCVLVLQHKVVHDLSKDFLMNIILQSNKAYNLRILSYCCTISSTCLDIL